MKRCNRLIKALLFHSIMRHWKMLIEINKKTRDTLWPHFRHNHIGGLSSVSSAFSCVLLSALQSWQTCHSTFSSAFFRWLCSSPLRICLHTGSTKHKAQESCRYRNKCGMSTGFKDAWYNPETVTISPKSKEHWMTT